MTWTGRRVGRDGGQKLTEWGALPGIGGDSQDAASRAEAARLFRNSIRLVVGERE